MKLELKPKAKKLPFKQTINLIEQKKAIKNPVKTFSLIGVCFILFVVVVKFAVVDRYIALSEQKAEIEGMQMEIGLLQANLMDYNKVVSEYNRYTTNWMTPGEKATVDRQDIMKLIADEIATVAQIQNYSALENVLSMNLTDITLDATAKLVQKLESLDDVEKVQVFNANSQNTTGEATSVSLFISLQNEAGVKQKEDAAAAAAAAAASGLNGLDGGVE